MQNLNDSSSAHSEPTRLELPTTLNVIPVRNKQPLVSWQEFQTRRSTEEDVKRWKVQFGVFDYGVVTGPISGVLVLDNDGNDALPQMPKTWTVKSPRGGRHHYFTWTEKIASVPTTKVGVLPKVDTRGAGGFCVLPSPGNAYTWEVSPSECDLAEPPQWLLDLLLSTKVEDKRNQPGWIAETLSSMEKGERHHALSKVIGSLNRAGYAVDDIFALLKPHAEDVSITAEDLFKQTQGMAERYASQMAKPLTGKTAKELLAGGKTQIDWLVDGLFPVEGCGILAGEAKIGKSWLLLDLALTVATGGRWLGQWNTCKGPVMYVDEESSENMLRYRFNKMLNHKKLTPDVNIHFHVKEGFSFSSDQRLEQLRAVMDLVRPKLLIFDSFNRVHNANENSASDMGNVFRRVSQLAKDYGCFVLFTDHLAKPNEYGNSRFRGSTDKEAYVDAGFLAAKTGISGLLVTHKYARLSSPLNPFELAIEDDGPDKTFVRWIG